MRCTVKPHIDVNREDWDTFVYSNSMGWAYFLYDLINFDRNRNRKDLSFAIIDEDNQNEILMIVQLCKANRHRFLGILNIANKLESQWGFVIKDNLSKKQKKTVKKAFEDYIDDYISRNNIRKFNINLPPLTESFLNNKTFVNPLIYYNFEPKIRYTCVVDLSKPTERMLADCEETTRQAIRKIESTNQYDIVEAKGTKQELKEYINLHKETYIRTRAEKSIIDDEYHKYMFFKLIPAKLCKVYFLREKNTNENIAAVSILIYKNTAYYWWGCSKSKKDIGINKYLLFKVLLKLKKQFNDTGYFETGGAYAHKRIGKYKGLYDFKKSFGDFYGYIRKDKKKKC